MTWNVFQFNEGQPGATLTNGSLTVDQNQPGTATISGRVFRPSGQALPNTRLFLTNQQNVRVGLATTSSFGIFSFSGVATGQTYVLTVASKRYRFTPQTLTVNGNITGLELVGLE